MKLLNGFFWYAMPGLIQGCGQPLDFDCGLVDTCTYPSINHHAVGSGRWATGRDCDGPDNQCIWEIQETKVGEAFEMYEGVLTIQITGLYMIDTALWNDNKDVSIDIRLRKNGNDISAG